MTLNMYPFAKRSTGDQLYDLKTCPIFDAHYLEQINPSQHCRASEVELTSYAPSSIAPTELSPSTGSCSYDDVPLTLTSSVRPGRSGGGVGVGSDSVSSRDEGLAPSRVGSRVSVEVDEHNNDEEARLEMLLNEEYGQPSGPVAAEAVAAVIAIDVSNLGEGKKQARELLISEEGEEEDNGGDSRGQGWQEEAGGGGEERLFSAPPGERRLFRRRIKACWWCGAALLVVGSLVNFASFGFAPQSLLASLGSVQFVSNVAFGKVSFLRGFWCRKLSQKNKYIYIYCYGELGVYLLARFGVGYKRVYKSVVVRMCVFVPVHDEFESIFFIFT